MWVTYFKIKACDAVSKQDDVGITCWAHKLWKEGESLIKIPKKRPYIERNILQLLFYPEFSVLRYDDTKMRVCLWLDTIKYLFRTTTWQGKQIKHKYEQQVLRNGFIHQNVKLNRIKYENMALKCNTALLRDLVKGKLILFNSTFLIKNFSRHKYDLDRVFTSNFFPLSKFKPLAAF